MDASLKKIGLLNDLQQQLLLITDEDLAASETNELFPEEQLAVEGGTYLGVLSKELKAMWALQHKLTIKEADLQRMAQTLTAEESARDVNQEIWNTRKTLLRLSWLIPLFLDWDFPAQDSARQFGVGQGFKVYSHHLDDKVLTYEV